MEGVKAERTEDGKIIITMDELRAKELGEFLGKVFRDEQGFHVLARDSLERRRLFVTVYSTSGALYELFNQEGPKKEIRNEQG